MIRIVIVNWNAGSQLLDCIRSIQDHENSLVEDIVVVDNGSTDDSVFAIKDLAGVTLIEAGKNLGFARACNLGAQGAKSEYLLFLNPDTRLFADSVIEPLNFMQQKRNSEIGICGVRLVDERGGFTTSAARFPTLRVMAGKILCLSSVMPKLFLRHQMSSVELSESCFVDQIIGAFFLIRKSVFDRCGGFDERFFVYFEEVDLSLRANHLGYSSYYLANVTAFHKGGGCSNRVKSTRLFYSLRSRIIYARKHYSRFEFAVLIVLTAIELPLRVTNGLFKFSLSDVSNTCLAYWNVSTNFLRNRR